MLIASTSLVLAGTARATGTDPSATIEKDERLFLVNTDGTWSMTRDLALVIRSERGVKTLSQQPFSYNATLETMEVIEAYTEKPDGRKVPVRPDRIREQQAKSSPDLNMFEDMRTKVAIFSQVEVGDRLVMQVRQHQVTALMPGQFQDTALPPAHQAGQVRLIYDLPEQMPLHADARGYVGSVVSAAPGRKRFQYDYVEHDRPVPEPGSVSLFDFGDRLVVSTMADHAALAAAYRKGAAGKADVTPAIRSLERSITRGVDGPRAQALALGDWVRQHIRYVASYIGAGGVVPHAADDILAHRYGDCKDHATLLESLLASAGIGSTVALISSGDAYTLPAIGALGMLNHVITYVPKLDLYIDSTAEDQAAGYLPQGDLGKTVVLVMSGTLGRTPLNQMDKVSIDSEVAIDAAGKYVATRTRTMQGAAAESDRQRIRAAKSNQQDGTTFDAGALEGSGDVFTTRKTSRGEVLLNGENQLVLDTSGSAGADIHLLAMTSSAAAHRPPRMLDYPCPAVDIEERARISVPANFRLAALPAPLALHLPDFDYSAEYRREQQVIVVHRHYHSHPVRAVCTPGDARAMQTLDPQIAADVLTPLRFDRQ